MTKEETSRILALFNIAGVKFDGDKKSILNLWSECLKETDYQFALQATKDIIKNETELFANGLIAKVRNKAKYLKGLLEIQVNKKLEGGNNDLRRIGRGNS